MVRYLFILILLTFITLSDAGFTCSAANKEVQNPLDNTRKFSGIYANQKPGTGHGRSMLDSIQGWSAPNNNAGHWIEIDLGKEMTVMGVVTQGRRDGQRVTSYAIETSKTGKSGEYLKIQEKDFAGNTDQSTKVANLFPTPVRTRYVRLFPKTFHSHISLRMGVVTCKSLDPSITYLKVADGKTCDSDHQNGGEYNLATPAACRKKCIETFLETYFIITKSKKCKCFQDCDMKHDEAGYTIYEIVSDHVGAEFSLKDLMIESEKTEIKKLNNDVEESEKETTKWKSRYTYVENNVDGVFEKAEATYKASAEESVGTNCAPVIQGNSWFKTIFQSTVALAVGTSIGFYVARSSTTTKPETEMLL